MAKKKVGAIMVVGGGISGMQSSLDLADSGFKVYLVEKSPTIGGVMAQLDKTFPTNDCAMCIMAPKLVGTGRHHNIYIISNSEIQKVEGGTGHFKITLTKHARRIDEEKCTGCGLCAQYCPVGASDEYNEGLTERRSIFLKYAQAVPLVYTIDKDLCLGCGTCESVCRANAISYDQKEEEVVIEVGSIILSPGFESFEGAFKKEYGYGICQNVLTSMEFERMLSATGPSGGIVIRPSDGDIPRRVAFIQCVGSRDEGAGVPYCSSICCMYSMKEAIIAKEHAEDMEATIFYMDIRAYGKEFEKYYQRAQDEYKIKFVRGRASSIEENLENNNLIVRHVEGNKVKSSEFDMVVLAVGFKPPSDAEKLAKMMKFDLDGKGFCDTSVFKPLDTSRPGIFVSGAFAGPRDIPETVADASGAAARASSVISSERGKLITVKEYPPEIEIKETDEPRIGVFVCHCGINIGGVVNVPGVVESVKSLPNVVYAEHNLYTCSQDTQEKITEKIKEHNLNRVVVASCTPRTHEPLFQNTCREAGLNPYLFEMTNIREHCSWVHMHNKEGATAKAKELARMAVAKVRLHEPLYMSRKAVKKAGLVIGGGLSGMTAALGLAEQGYDAFLVEKEDELGGILRRIHYLADPADDPQVKLKELVKAVESNPKIKVFKGATMKSIEGSIGGFKTVVEAGGNEETIEHGIVIVAIGAVEYKPTEYLYGKNPAVMTQLELEEKLSKGVVKGDTFVVIQCVGARNKDWPNCSRICCVEALKNINKLKEALPDAEVYVLNRDIRAYGFYENLYREVRGKGVHFITYDDENMPKVSEENGKIRVEIGDDILEKGLVIRPDHLILSVAARPAPSTEEIAQMLKVSTTADGYFLEAHMKLRPVEFMTDGIFLCGLAHGPRLVEESISQAQGAVVKACTILSKDELEVGAVVSRVVEDRCVMCGSCIDVCSFGAATENEEAGKSEINPVLCKGCGLCAASCPVEAIIPAHFSIEKVMAQVKAFVGTDESGKTKKVEEKEKEVT